MTSLTENFLRLAAAFLYRSPLTEGEFGECALGDGEFVASLRNGGVPAMDAADRALLLMGEPTIGPAFRPEIAAFLLITETDGTCWDVRLSENPAS